MFFHLEKKINFHFRFARKQTMQTFVRWQELWLHPKGLLQRPLDFRGTVPFRVAISSVQQVSGAPWILRVFVLLTSLQKSLGEVTYVLSLVSFVSILSGIVVGL